MTFPTTVVVPLEGDYTTWTLVWTKDYGAGLTLDGVFVDNDGSCYIIDWLVDKAYFRDYDGNEDDTIDYMYLISTLWDPPHLFSETGKYVVANNVGAAGIQMDIWREGAIIASINLLTDNADADDFWEGCMSSNGKFIVFIVTSIASGDSQYVMLYEGT